MLNCGLAHVNPACRVTLYACVQPARLLVQAKLIVATAKLDYETEIQSIGF